MPIENPPVRSASIGRTDHPHGAHPPQTPTPTTSRPAAQLERPDALAARPPGTGHAHHSMRFSPLPVDSQPRRPWASARFSSPGDEAGTSSLLPPPSFGRSDRFEIELTAFEGAGHHETEATAGTQQEETGDVDRSSSGSSRSSSGYWVIEIDPPRPPEAPVTPRGQIEAALGRLQFSAPEGPLREAQQALEQEYIGWAAEVATRRQAIFGDGRYSIGSPAPGPAGETPHGVDPNQKRNFGEAVLPAVYDFARQFVSSSSRSPVRNAVATALAPQYTQVAGQRINVGEFSNGWDSSIVGGSLGGVSAHAVDSSFLTAMDGEAKKANMPQLKPVDLKALVPDPGEVQLAVVDGRKHYWRLSDSVQADAETGEAAAAGRPTRAQLQEEVKVRRQALASVQDILEAKNWGLFAQPLVTGAFNVLRRVVMPAASLLQPAPVFLGSVLASGTAGAVTKLGLGLLKPTAQAGVDDLVGGQQRVNLFATKLPDPSQEPARLSDITKLPGRAASVLKETAALGTHFLAGPWRDSGSWMPSRDATLARVGDVMRAVTANTLASVLSTATGPLVASVARQGLTVPGENEASDSPAYLLQQAATSATNDYVWQASKEAHKNSAFDLAGSLDRWRARTDRAHSE